MQLVNPDFRVDLSLHLLSVLVGGAIALSLVWQLVAVLSPLVDFQPTTLSVPSTDPGEDEAGPPAWAAFDETPSPAHDELLAPRITTHFTVFRCEANGRVTYTDRPCERGGMRVLRLPRR
jgi:hypothetical protein